MRRTCTHARTPPISTALYTSDPRLQWHVMVNELSYLRPAPREEQHRCCRYRLTPDLTLSLPLPPSRTYVPAWTKDVSSTGKCLQQAQITAGQFEPSSSNLLKVALYTYGAFCVLPSKYPVVIGYCPLKETKYGNSFVGRNTWRQRMCDLCPENCAHTCASLIFGERGYAISFFFPPLVPPYPLPERRVL